MGFSGVEAAGYAEGKFYGLSPQVFKQKVVDMGMDILSSHAGLSLAENIQDTDWEEVWEWWEQAITAHKAADIGYIIVPWMPVPKTLSDLKVYCDYYNEIGRRCQLAGIKFGYHNHAFEFDEIENETMYDFMLEQTDPELVLFQMDVYWVVMGKESPVEYFSNYPGRFGMLHLKDRKELGQSGMVGFDAILSRTEQAGARFVILEVGQYSFKPMQSVKMSYDYLVDNFGFTN